MLRRAVIAGAALALASLVLAACGPSGTTSTTTTSPGSTTTTVSGPVTGSLEWSAPQTIASGSRLTQVSCATTTFCMAVDDAGRVYAYNGSTWSAGTPLSGSAGANSAASGSASAGTSYNGTPQVSCPTTTFCIALSGGSNVVQWDGAAWSPSTEVGGAASLQALSCASPSFCVAMDGIGDGYAFDGSWEGPVNAYGGSSDVSCVSPDFCMSASAGPSEWNGSSWSQPGGQDTNAELLSVSCTAPTFCLTGDSDGNVLTWNGSTWTAPERVDHGSASTGVAGTGSGGSAKLSGISCTATTFCIAVDGGGRALAFDGTAWSSPVTIAEHTGLTSVSCVGTTFCAAATSAGSVVMAKPKP